MYEIIATYKGNKEESITFKEEPSIEVDGYFVFVNCGQGQSLTSKLVDTLIKISLKRPLNHPQCAPTFKYRMDIIYETDNGEEVEVLFSPYELEVSTEGDDTMPVIIVSEGDEICRVINGTYLKSIKVTTYSDEGK